MPAERDLKKLLQSLNPKLSSETYVFCTLDNDSVSNAGKNAENDTVSVLNSVTPLASFQEKEGLSLILPKFEADNHQLSYEGLFSLISLNVYSSLEAVGMTAAIAEKLTKNNISANIIAAYHHDHILVPIADAERALLALGEFKQARA